MKVVSKMHLEYLNPKASGAVYKADIEPKAENAWLGWGMYFVDD
jgi:hypothetical protein